MTVEGVVAWVATTTKRRTAEVVVVALVDTAVRAVEAGAGRINLVLGVCSLGLRELGVAALVVTRATTLRSSFAEVLEVAESDTAAKGSVAAARLPATEVAVEAAVGQRAATAIRRGRGRAAALEVVAEAVPEAVSPTPEPMVRACPESSGSYGPEIAAGSPLPTSDSCRSRFGPAAGVDRFSC